MDNRYDYKQVIIVRTDLKMRQGKAGVQISHASESWLRDRESRLGCLILDEGEREWFLGPLHKKIALRCDSEEELLALLAKAKERKLLAFLVTDAGLTEFNGPTNTAIAIGPNAVEDFVGITDHLKPL